MAAASAESEPELDAAQLDDLLRELEPLENEYEAVSRAGRKDISCHQHLENIYVLIPNVKSQTRKIQAKMRRPRSSKSWTKSLDR